MKIAVIVNPEARARSGKGTIDVVVRGLRGRGHMVELATAQTAPETSELVARAAADADTVVVAGGDGTVNLAVNALATGSANAHAPLGIIPTGTGNELARALGILETNPEEIVLSIDAKRTRSIDLARVTLADGTTRRFATVLASGLDAAINERANRLRWPRGEARYTVAMLLEFLFMRGYEYEVELDGRVERGRAVMVTVGNTGTYGGGVPVFPSASPSDGILDVMVVTAAGRLRLAKLVPALYRGGHVGRREVHMRAARSIVLRAPGSLAYADGDRFGELPIRIDVEAASLHVVAGPQRDIVA